MSKKNSDNDKKEQSNENKNVEANIDETVDKNNNNNNNNNDNNKESKNEDVKNICFLLFLYFLQGIPLGLMFSIPLILSSRKVSYADQGLFSFAMWPFSLKLVRHVLNAF